MSELRARHLLIGLDGAGLDIIEGLGAAALPNLHACMARGVRAALRSVRPPATLPNWTTLLTGVNPGRHGVFDFTLRRGYRVQFTAGSVRATPTLIRELDRRGLRCACLFFPGTFPPERLEHGVYASGWDAPVAFEADASFVWPRSLYREIVARFGPERFDDVDQFDAQAPGWHAQLPAALSRRIERRVELARWLLARDEFELFAIYFGESDTAAHHLWSLHDPCSPRRPPQLSAEEEGGLAQVYRALDRAVGELLAAAGGGRVELTLVSDHGSGGASDRVLYLNRALEAAGLLRMRRRGAGQWALGRAKDLALTQLPPRWRERLFRAGGALLPGLVESRARFGAIDMPRTRVFSDELNYFPALHYNLRGREPQGCVDPGEIPRLRAELEAALFALRDPYSGTPVVTRIHAREELFHGGFVERAPDLLLELALPDGYSYNLMPSHAAGSGEERRWPRIGAAREPPPLFRRLSAREYLGRKGRSLAGSHRDRGFFAACGPSVRAAGLIDAAMADVSATLLARMGVEPAMPLDGRVLAEALQPDRGAASARSSPGADPTESASGATSSVGQSSAGAATPEGATLTSPSVSRTGAARVEERLRRLGYIE
jgi:predicted AlkP superfamily phosphohydrolase/phosphomutase